MVFTNVHLKAKKNFQELLLERADLFYQFRSSPAGTVTQDDIMDITDKLHEDFRFKALDRLDPDRKLMLFQVTMTFDSFTKYSG